MTCSVFAGWLCVNCISVFPNDGTLVGLPVAVLGIFTCAQMLVTVAHTVHTVNVIGAVGTQEILC